MPNTKTGTTWAPDIRPEKIETFEETYTPEGGEQQIIKYRAVNHHPILNKVLDKMAFFRTHVGAIWYNLAERKTLLTKLNELDAELREVNAKSKIVMGENFEPVTYPFFVPEDGHLYVQVTGDPAYLYLNSEKFNFSAAPYRHYFALYIRGNSVLAQFCPVKKGDTISAAGRSGQTYSCFIPKS